MQDGIEFILLSWWQVAHKRELRTSAVRVYSPTKRKRHWLASDAWPRYSINGRCAFFIYSSTKCGETTTSPLLWPGCQRWLWSIITMDATYHSLGWSLCFFFYLVPADSEQVSICGQLKAYVSSYPVFNNKFTEFITMIWRCPNLTMIPASFEQLAESFYNSKLIHCRNHDRWRSFTWAINDIVTPLRY